MRFDEGGCSVAYAIDFSDLTDDMASLYEGADVWIADCLTRRPHPTHAHLEGVLAGRGSFASARSISCTWAMASIIARWSPSCPIGRRRLMTGWRSMLMTNDVMLGGLYILMAMMLVLGSLMAGANRRQVVTMALAWVVIFAGGFILFTFRDDFGWVAQRLKAEAVGTRSSRAAKPASRWPSTAISGSRAGQRQQIKFLVDSGATMTTIDRDTALPRLGRLSRRSATNMSAPAMA